MAEVLYQLLEPPAPPTWCHCWVIFPPGPDTAGTDAPCCRSASLWNDVGVTFLPAKAFSCPQLQEICTPFLLHFLEQSQGNPGMRHFFKPKGRPPTFNGKGWNKGSIDPSTTSPQNLFIYRSNGTVCSENSFMCSTFPIKTKEQACTFISKTGQFLTLLKLVRMSITFSDGLFEITVAYLPPAHQCFGVRRCLNSRQCHRELVLRPRYFCSFQAHLNTCKCKFRLWHILQAWCKCAIKSNAQFPRAYRDAFRIRKACNSKADVFSVLFKPPKKQFHYMEWNREGEVNTSKQMHDIQSQSEVLDMKCLNWSRVLWKTSVWKHVHPPTREICRMRLTIWWVMPSQKNVTFCILLLVVSGVTVHWCFCALSLTCGYDWN